MKIRSRFLTRCLAWLVVRMGQLWFRTCRVKFLAPADWLRLDCVTRPEEAPRVVACVWHDALLIPTFVSPAGNRRQTCCLVSQHQDGSYLAEAMDFLGYSTVRGSTRRGGAAAVKQLIDETAGRHIVITPDGPRGPRRQVKPGAIFVASQTGRPVCAAACACRSAWKIQGSWTDMIIPLPFTTIFTVIGSPIAIPADLSREELARYTRMVQDAMDRLYDQVERLARGECERIEFDGQAGDASRLAA